jgi:hypothetical protein
LWKAHEAGLARVEIVGAVGTARQPSGTYTLVVTEMVEVPEDQRVKEGRQGVETYPCLILLVVFGR